MNSTNKFYWGAIRGVFAQHLSVWGRWLQPTDLPDGLGFCIPMVQGDGVAQKIHVTVGDDARDAFLFAPSRGEDHLRQLAAGASMSLTRQMARYAGDPDLKPHRVRLGGEVLGIE